jgi:uncharacterized protein YqgV (UPF0045/DUF77 family)
VVHSVNEQLFRMGCAEWIAGVQFNIRSNGDITANEKVSKFIV